MILTPILLGLAASLHCVGMCGPLMLALPLSAPIASAAPGDVIGGMDFDGFCKRHHGATSNAVIVENNAFGWRCNSGYRLHGVWTPDLCKEQYGTSYADSRYSNWNDPYSWVCISTR